MIKAAVMGYGTIGSGVAEILEENKKEIAKSVGQKIELKYVLDLRDFPDSPVADKVIHDFSRIEQDSEIKIVVETMGGLNPAYPFVKACLLAGKHVVTSNKALVAAYGTELLEIARERAVNFLFEGSVGGGIPIIRPMYRCLGGERIQEITGILNGTTNYILTKMEKEGETFESALREAQELGYAERDPKADVEGHDTCRKLAILTAMATGRQVDFEEIHTEGITKITDTDFQYAARMGASIKLFGSSRIEEDKVSAFVVPMMIGKKHPLFLVSDVYNGIMVKGNMLGNTMFVGSGAGKLPTAGAVVADMIEAGQNLSQNIPIGWGQERQGLRPMETNRFRYFARIGGMPGKCQGILGQTFGQAEQICLEGLDEFALFTGEMDESCFLEGKKALEAAGVDIRQVIRAEI